jgi:hypothetical protein
VQLGGAWVQLGGTWVQLGGTWAAALAAPGVRLAKKQRQRILPGVRKK